MKRAYFAIAALALIACASAADDDYDKRDNRLPDDDKAPSVPGDNSHYVEGKSRYIWFPDQQGTPILVDLQEPVDEAAIQQLTKDGSKNEYWLFTRQNPNDHQVLIDGDKDSVTRSHYRADRPTNVIVHGWRSSGSAAVNIQITAAFLLAQDCNVIVVDWSKIADTWNYPGAAAAVPSVGNYLGDFLIWLFNNVGGNWDTLHLSGHSLGAHVVGNAGRTINGRAKRVSGLDPAGPKWNTNPNALDTRSGKYVEAIHTNGGTLGLWRTVGHADFYPNGGSSQPGCWISICSHSRAYELFAATIQFDRLEGKQCKDLSEAEKKRCAGAGYKMGNSLINKTGSGIYGLTTGSNWPF